MIIKADGTVDCVTSFEELERVKDLVPKLIVRDLNGKMIPGIQELNTDTMDALMFLRVEDNAYLCANRPFTTRSEIVKVRVCLGGCSIFSSEVDVNCDTFRTVEIPLDKNLRPVGDADARS